MPHPGRGRPRGRPTPLRHANFHMCSVNVFFLLFFVLLQTATGKDTRMSVVDLFSPLVGIARVRYVKNDSIVENVVFRCPYRVTAYILFVCSFVGTAYHSNGMTHCPPSHRIFLSAVFFSEKEVLTHSEFIFNLFF